MNIDVKIEKPKDEAAFFQDLAERLRMYYELNTKPTENGLMVMPAFLNGGWQERRKKSYHIRNGMISIVQKEDGYYLRFSHNNSMFIMFGSLGIFASMIAAFFYYAQDSEASFSFFLLVPLIFISGIMGLNVLLLYYKIKRMMTTCKPPTVK